MTFDLNTLWFILVAVLYIGFFVLEGFDFGVGMLLPFVAKTDNERRQVINTIGPHWDGNEVWLLTAGGATFAAFPQWYATLFSGLYLALFLLLMALIVRGVAFEYRSKDDNPTWRKFWDWAIAVCSFLPALLLGVAFGNLAEGLPIDANFQYAGGFFNLLNWFALLSGVTAVLVFLLHGSIFLSMKTTDVVKERVEKFAKLISWPAVIAMLLLGIATYLATDIYARLGLVPGVVPLIGLVALVAAAVLVGRNQFGWSFAMTSLAILGTITTTFMIMFPRVIISSLNPEWSLTIYNASSSDYTLTVMTVVALIFVPIVLVYQGWSYWVFRKRIAADPQKLVY